jgi:hypothetical protein
LTSSDPVLQHRVARHVVARLTRIMRIAQVAPLYERVPPVRYGGTERVVAHLTDELVRRQACLHDQARGVPSSRRGVLHRRADGGFVRSRVLAPDGHDPGGMTSGSGPEDASDPRLTHPHGILALG